MSESERLGEDVHIKNCFGLISYYFDHLHICSSSSTTRQTNTLNSHKYFSFILFMLLLPLPLCFVSCLSCVYVLNCHMIEITCMKLEHCTQSDIEREREQVHIYIFLKIKNFCELCGTRFISVFTDFIFMFFFISHKKMIFQMCDDDVDDE